MTRDGFTFLAMGFTGPRAAVFKEAYIEAFNKMEADRDRVHLFFRVYPQVYFSGGEVESSILRSPLIPWKYRGFYVNPKVGARRALGLAPVETTDTKAVGVSKVYILLGFERKIFEGLRRSTRRRFTPWRGGRSVPERNRLGVLLRGTILSCSPRPARTGSG